VTWGPYPSTGPHGFCLTAPSHTPDTVTAKQGGLFPLMHSCAQCKEEYVWTTMQLPMLQCALMQMQRSTPDMQQAGKIMKVLMRPLPCCPAVVCDLGALSLYRTTWLLPHHSNPGTVCDLGALSLYRTTCTAPSHTPSTVTAIQGSLFPLMQLCTVQGGVRVDNNAAAKTGSYTLARAATSQSLRGAHLIQ